MSKKLLMNNYSENGLIPVTDGLICWLDGRDGSVADTLWRDRSTHGNDAVLKKFNFDNSNGWTGSSLLFNGKNYCDIKNLNMIEGNNKTFELELHDNLYQVVGFLSNRTRANDGFSLLHYNRNFALDINYNNVIQRQQVFEFSGVITVSIDESGEVKFYKNGVYLKTLKYNTFNSDFPYNTSAWRLGAFGNTDAGITGKVSFVRIYNRVLTEEEVQQNYLYEQSIERS